MKAAAAPNEKPPQVTTSNQENSKLEPKKEEGSEGGQDGTQSHQSETDSNDTTNVKGTPILLMS